MTTLATRIPGYVAGTWDIDPGHSRISFTARHLGVRKVHGHFDRFIGQVVTAEDPLRSSAAATVDLDSVNTGDPARDQDLRSGNFLGTADFPAMNYRTTGVRHEGRDYLVDGELTVHGVTQPVSLRFDFAGFRPGPEGATRAAFRAAGEVHRHDFGVVFDVPVLGLASDKIHIYVEAEAVLRPGTAATPPR